jgi:chromosome segregation ATPase|tara:strand:+ start:245 stop:781 length:537 start_codon:yes stop_codon:yes gene_type:complete
MDKLGGKLPLISIALVVVLQLVGAVTYMTNISRDIESNSAALEDIFQTPDEYDRFNDELYIARKEIETIKQYIEQHAFLAGEVAQIRAELNAFADSGATQDLNDAIRRLNNIEGSIQFLRDDQSVQEVGSKLSWLESNVVRNEAQVQSNSQEIDQINWELTEITKRLIYIEENARGIR